MTQPHIENLRTTLQCNQYYGGRPGAANGGYCFPDGVWASAASGDKWGYRLKSGTFGITFNGVSDPRTYSTGVRCVLDLNYRLQLCDYYSGYGALQCQNRSGCTGAAGNNCNPNYVWSGTLNSGTNYYNRYLNSGTFNNNWNDHTNAFSVRCVPDLDFLKQKEILQSSSVTDMRITVPYGATN